MLGAGAVGSRVARWLLELEPGAQVVLGGSDPERVAELVQALGSAAAAAGNGHLHDQGIDVLVIAAPCGRHVGPARRAIRAGVPMVSTSDRVEDIHSLRALTPRAENAAVTSLVGAGFAPGLSCLQAAQGSAAFDVVDEIHVAKAGTGGPACARQHHRALKGSARDWRDGAWIRRPGGSGRELVWFPEPVSGADCYRGALPDALLLQPFVPDAARITSRMAATRQDRFTSWLPMLSPPHPEGGVGAVRVEIRGRAGASSVVRILGAVERPAVGAGAVAALAALALWEGAAGPPGVRGLAGSVDARAALERLARHGLRAQEFDGIAPV